MTNRSTVYCRLVLAASVMSCMVASAVAPSARAQILRTDFSHGGAAPDGWRLSGGAGRWETSGPGKSRSVSVTGTGEDMNYWSRTTPDLRPGATYGIRFQARVVPGSSVSSVISGLDACNRDFSVTADWQPYHFVFTTPRDVSHSFVRLGQWHLKGVVAFSDFVLAPVVPVYRRQGVLVLGQGEQVEGRTYAFTAPLAGEGSDSARTLASHTAAFNSNRWVFGTDSEVVYRHSLPSARQTTGQVTVSVNYHTGGQCVISASRDGQTWVEAARIQGVGSRTAVLPASLFPARSIWVRLRGASASGRAGNSEPGAFQVDAYSYRANLDASLPTLSGSTHFLEVERQDPRIAVQVEDLGELPGRTALRAVVTPAKEWAGRAVVSVRLSSPSGTMAEAHDTLTLKPGTPQSVSLPYRWERTGRGRMRIEVRSASDNRALFAAETERYVPQYYAVDYGHALPPMPEGQLWWCEGTYKVSPHRHAPDGPLKRKPGLQPNPPDTEEGIRLSAAGRERVAIQLVVSAGKNPGAIRVAVSDLVGPGGARIPNSSVQIREVEYVRVRVPTDQIGVADEWPDPLPPLDGLWRPKPDRNNPLWITVTAPAGATPGDYFGHIDLHGRRRQIVPLRLHVRSFSLPERTALRSGFGISPGTIGRFHNLSSAGAMDKTWDLYMRDFAVHRLCPYNPMALAPIKVSLTAGPNPHIDLDFAEFDRAAHHYLDEIGFNSFTLGVMGMGTGRYPTYNQGSLLGHPAGTPEYDTLMRDYGRQLQDHLARMGWLNKAYVYWYDEPETQDYPFVVEGMERLRRYFPDLKRMLTEEFEPPLYGHVDLWCPITPNFAAEPARARQSKGEEVWWYVCTGPKEPYCALFIDHPAIEMRMWLWQTWKYHVQGILIWETTWWTSPSQFKDRVQNCWEDPMSYTSEASGVWGNGDGRFFYPPNRRPNEDRSTPFAGAPIDSLRWEMLGEGIQDWEYFHLLDELVRQADARGDRSAGANEARRLLMIPDSICRDMTHYTTDPQLLYQYRERVARAIEVLERAQGSPGQPSMVQQKTRL